MKTIIKLVIVVAILNAVIRGGMATWTYFEFRDATEQRLIVDVQWTVDELTDAILDDAFDRHLPLTPENLSVQREGVRTWATASYTQPVEFFPTYVYPVRFSFTVEATNQLMVPPGRSR